MKIAIFHNSIDNIGGAEKVCLLLSRELGADLYTTNIDAEKIKKMGFEGINIKSIGKIPVNAPFRQQAALKKFNKLNLKNQYDFYIIGGDWAISAAVNHHPNLWYAHSALREVFGFREYVKEKMMPFYLRLFYDLWSVAIRRKIKKYVGQADQIICNSYNTKKRISEYFNRQAGVIYPPIDTSQYYYQPSGDYWLSVNRLIPHKRIEMQLEVFRQMLKEKLIIVGCYEQARHFKKYANYLYKIKPENVEILSWIDNQELINLYASCKGLITTSLDEDFGMTPVEAMAAGKPVIAPNEGGYKETIINNLTGKLIDNITIEKLIIAIKEVGKNSEKYKDACKNQAKKFDQEIFLSKIKELIK